MGIINLYKIDNTKKEALLKELSEKFELDKHISLPIENFEEIGFTLYTQFNSQGTELSWKWILSEFGQSAAQIFPSPKAVVLAEKEDDTTYAITYGSAFFTVDKFCDRNFGFSFARKLSFDKIKTTTLTTPSSHRNKTVSTYINYDELEFDSGESFAKLKAKVDVEEGFELFNPSIEIGNSIKISTSKETLSNIARIIVYIENIISNLEDKCKIPVFLKVSDPQYIDELTSKMEDKIKENPDISISELDIIGANEIFNNSDDEFIIAYSRKEKKITDLNVDELKQFCEENGFDYSNIVLNIKVKKIQDGQIVCTKLVRELIEYTADYEQCLFTGGKWYRYNDDYLNYLAESINKIPTIYYSEYDFKESKHDAFIDEMYIKEKGNVENKDKDKKQIYKSLKRKYYAERVFNILMGRREGFQNMDRNLKYINNHRIEPMDLYKVDENGHYAFAVKIGDSSAKLSYAVDQSLITLKMIKNGELTDIPDIDTVVLWFILDKHIEDKNGIPDINKLNLLTLKNKIVQWKKEVRLSGYNPMIYINYRIK